MAKQSRDFKTTFYNMFKFLNFINKKQRSVDLRYDPLRPVYSYLIYDKIFTAVMIIDVLFIILVQSVTFLLQDIGVKMSKI